MSLSFYHKPRQLHFILCYCLVPVSKSGLSQSSLFGRPVEELHKLGLPWSSKYTDNTVERQLLPSQRVISADSGETCENFLGGET